MHKCTVHSWKSQPLRLKAKKKKKKVETRFAPRRGRKMRKPNIAVVDEDEVEDEYVDMCF